MNMKQLDEIIDLLADETVPLSRALLKAKVLLHKLAISESTAWLDHEMNGYPKGATLPDYRVLKGLVHGTVAIPGGRYPSYPLPTMHLDDKLRESVEMMPFNQSIGALQELVSQDGKLVSLPLPLEMNNLLGQCFERGANVERAWRQVGRHSVAQIMNNVRTRLLEFLLSLRDQVGDVKDPGAAVEAAKALDLGSAFQGMVLGNNAVATVIVGNNNTQTVNAHNRAGDRDALFEELRKHKVPDSEIKALDAALDKDGIPPARGKFGTAVSGWFGRQMTRAASAAWNIELGIAGGLLTTALQNYYG